jgi:predicted phosphodiesterase
MADAPYTDHERENTMPYQINNLSDSADFLVHLGDLQDAQVDKCREPAYQAAEDVLRQSRIPVFVIPGGKC